MNSQSNKFARPVAAQNTKARAVRASRSPAAGVPKAAAGHAATQKKGGFVKKTPVKAQAPIPKSAAQAVNAPAPIEEIKQEEEEKKTAVELAIERNNATLARLENFQKNSQSNALQEKMRKLQAASETVINGVGKCEEIRDRIQAKMASKMEEVKETSEARFMARVKQSKVAN